MSWLVMSSLVAIALLIRSKLVLQPNPLQNIAELIVESLSNLIESVAFERARTFFPIIATLFLFILFSNWFGLLPGLNAIGIYHTVDGSKELIPLFRSPAS